MSGDAARVIQRHGHLLAIVSDGLGHGPPAHDASARATAWLDAHPSADVSVLMTGLHTALQGTIGAAIGIGSINQADRALRFVGVGNIVARIFGKRPRGLMSRPGTVGLAMSTAQVQTDKLEVGDVLVMHSDGISSSFKLEDYAVILEASPEISSSEIVRRFGKPYDDASCVVAKCEA
ncbi:MAG: SpoIIE family protein phosphatase [Thalassobaculaceae bacterium]